MKTFVVAGYFNSKFGDDSRRYEEATISRNRVVLDLDGARKMVAGAAYIAMISNDISRVKTWQDLSFSTYYILIQKNRGLREPFFFWNPYF
jgi:hypothetical protein